MAGNTFNGIMFECTCFILWHLSFRLFYIFLLFCLMHMFCLFSIAPNRVFPYIRASKRHVKCIKKYIHFSGY